MRESHWFFTNDQPPHVWQWRYWRMRLMRKKWYLWMGSFMARLLARVRKAPKAKPCVFGNRVDRFRICIWEGDGAYVATAIRIPGANIELLRHPHCNRIIGIKIWD